MNAKSLTVMSMVAAITAVFLSSSILAQAPVQLSSQADATGPVPSLDQTERFITDKVSEQGHIYAITKFSYLSSHSSGYITDVQDSWRIFSFDKCRLTDNYNPQAGHGYTWKFDLDKVKAISIKSGDAIALEKARVIYPNDNLASLSPQAPSLVAVVISLGAAPDGSARDDYVYFRSHDVALRVSKALAHAIAICGGGKAEPF